jgi:hypothetical protein
MNKAPRHVEWSSGFQHWASWWDASTSEFRETMERRNDVVMPATLVIEQLSLRCPLDTRDAYLFARHCCL